MKMGMQRKKRKTGRNIKYGILKKILSKYEQKKIVKVPFFVGVQSTQKGF